MSKIMIVDDSVVIREKLKILLTKAGHEVVAEAGNGLQAALLYTRLKPDIVTMDITMPGVDGLEGIRRIREVEPTAQVVVVSAMGQRDVIIEALDAGATGFILKPFNVNKVLSVMEAVEERLRKGVPEDNSSRLRAELDALRQETERTVPDEARTEKKG